MVEFYYHERSSQVNALCALLRLSHALRLDSTLPPLERDDPYAQEARKAVRALRKDNLHEQLVQRLKADWPTEPPASVRANIQSAALWADQQVKEQALLLECVMMVNYKERVESAQVMELLTLAKQHNFGAAQPLYMYLSETGRRTARWAQHMWTLLAIQCTQMRGLDADEPDSDAALHPLLNSESLAAFAHFWDTTALNPQHGPALLAWAVLLAHVAERQLVDGWTDAYRVQELLTRAVKLRAHAGLLELLQGLALSAVPHCGTAHKKIAKDLLWALFQVGVREFLFVCVCAPVSSSSLSRCFHLSHSWPTACFAFPRSPPATSPWQPRVSAWTHSTACFRWCSRTSPRCAVRCGAGTWPTSASVRRCWPRRPWTSQGTRTRRGS